MAKGTDWTEALSRIKEILSQTELTETKKWGMPVYTFEGKNIMGFAGMKNYFALWFYDGVFLSDPYQVLINAQEGKTKAMRQWRLEDPNEIEEKKILKYVTEAIKNAKDGKTWKPEKSEPIPIPSIFQEKLKANKELKEAFDNLTPYKQKEYIEYIATAKREATQVSRLEKITPMISQGKGLNDKYK